METRTIKEKELFEKLGKFIRVENAESRNGYASAPNQFIVTYERGVAFQSYKSFIGVCLNGEYYFNYLHDYSKTTSSHITRWCGYDAKERRKGLESGKFIKIVD